MNYKYSIIIPIYKVEKYLRNCINSVLNQTFKNYEIILVDDGSPDSCGAICDEFSNKYSFIKTIHKKNGGLSDARNVGLQNATGEYVIFLDSDDFWIDNEFLNNNLKKLDGKDLIIFNSIKYYSDNKKGSSRFQITDEFETLSRQERMNYIIQNNIYKACAWDKIIKRSLLINNEITFPVGKLSEDMKWAGDLLDAISDIDIYEKNVYAYRQREGSISKSVSSKHIEDIITQLSTSYSNKLIYNYLAYEYSVLLSYAYCASKEQKKKIKELSYLLDYDLSNKVKMVKKIYSLFGFYFSSKILRLFVYIKTIF